MTKRLDAVVIGGGQAGLAISYFLMQQGREHIVLEEHDVGQAWRTRWVSFTLVTPNWTLKLPGHEYAGNDPDGFLLRHEVVQYLEDYQAKYEMPMRSGVRATALEHGDGDSRFLVKTDQGDFQATNVVVATGFGFDFYFRHTNASQAFRGLQRFVNIRFRRYLTQRSKGRGFGWKRFPNSKLYAMGLVYIGSGMLEYVAKPVHGGR